MQPFGFPNFSANFFKVQLVADNYEYGVDEQRLFMILLRSLISLLFFSINRWLLWSPIAARVP